MISSCREENFTRIDTIGGSSILPATGCIRVDRGLHRRGQRGVVVDVNALFLLVVPAWLVLARGRSGRKG